MKTAYYDIDIHIDLNDLHFYRDEKDGDEHNILSLNENDFISCIIKHDGSTIYQGYSPILQAQSQSTLGNLYKELFNRFSAPCTASDDEIELFIKEQNHNEKMQEPPTGTLIA